MNCRKKGYLLIIFAAVIYSTTEVVLKDLSGTFAPMQLTLERTMLGSLVLCPFAIREWVRRHVHLFRADVGLFLLLSFLTITVNMSFLQLACTSENASAVAAIYSGTPVFSLLLSVWILHEPLSRNHVAAILFEIIGIIVILNPTQMEMSVVGFVQTVIATFCFSFYGVLNKLRIQKFGSLLTTFLNMAFGSAQLLFLLLLGRTHTVAVIYRYIGLEIFIDVPFFQGFTPHSTAVFLYIGVVVCGIGFFLMTKIVEYTSALESSFIYLVKPIISLGFAVLLLHERVSAHHLYGICFFAVASLCMLFPALKTKKYLE